LPQRAAVLRVNAKKLCHVLVLLPLFSQMYYLIPECLLNFLFKFSSIYLFHGKSIPQGDHVFKYLIAVVIVKKTGAEKFGLLGKLMSIPINEKRSTIFWFVRLSSAS